MHQGGHHSPVNSVRGDIIHWGTLFTPVPKFRGLDVSTPQAFFTGIIFSMKSPDVRYSSTTFILFSASNMWDNYFWRLSTTPSDVLVHHDKILKRQKLGWRPEYEIFVSMLYVIQHVRNICLASCVRWDTERNCRLTLCNIVRSQWSLRWVSLSAMMVILSLLDSLTTSPALSHWRTQQTPQLSNGWVPTTTHYSIAVISLWKDCE